MRPDQGTLASTVPQIAFKEPNLSIMKSMIVLSAILAVAVARPGILLAPSVAAVSSPIAYAKLVPGAPIGYDGRVVDTPEVALAKAEHAAAHINERLTLANEAVKSADHIVAYTSPILASNVEQYAIAKLVHPAPIGLDGRVVDTPEVALAKAEHAAAHLNEKLEHAAKSSLELPVVLSPYSSPVIQKVLF